MILIDFLLLMILQNRSSKSQILEIQIHDSQMSKHWIVWIQIHSHLSHIQRM